MMIHGIAMFLHMFDISFISATTYSIMAIEECTTTSTPQHHRPDSNYNRHQPYSVSNTAYRAMYFRLMLIRMTNNTRTVTISPT